MGRVMLAARVDVVGGVWHSNGGSWIPASGTAGSQRHVGVIAELLVRMGITPGELRDPQVDVVAVVKLDIPGETVNALGPIKFVAANRGVERISASCQVIPST